jgi:cysteine desulfurase
MARSTGSSSERPRNQFGAGPATRVYLDYAGFAPVDPRVVAVMRPFLEGGVGNPSAPHSLGLEARAALDSARAKIARLVGGAAAGVVFTASATEANNLAIRGLAQRAAGRHVVTSAIEHISVVNSCRELEKRGYAVTVVPVDREGRVDPDAVARALRPDTALVSLMLANGEIGTLQPIHEVGRLTSERRVPLHVDGVGAVGHVPVLVDEQGIDLLTLSSNDLYGPPGAGALWVRPGVKIAPIVLGGGQEGGYRAGTENVPALVGMGVAADLARGEAAAEAARLRELRERLLLSLEGLPGVRITGARAAERLPHHASVVVMGAKADSVLMELDLRGVSASSGSACAASTGEPSHVLRSIGCAREEVEGSLCFTLGRWTTAAEIDIVVDLLPGILARLRRLAP